jgi:mRNA interferase RelE/StbE
MKKQTFKLRVTDDVANLLCTLHPKLKKKVRASLKAILSEPESGKELKDELEGLKSFRVSRFRIIYRISSGKRIEVIAIGPRERIYEETYRILRKKEIKEKTP